VEISVKIRPKSAQSIIQNLHPEFSVAFAEAVERRLNHDVG
jgi:hypothetical protein